MDAYKDVFLAESADFLQQIIDGLLVLEADPRDLEPVEVIFRGAHSLKGMSAAMGYDRTADLTHKMEGLMDRVRKGQASPDRVVTDLMLAAVDLVRDLIDDESAGTNQVDSSEMAAALQAATAADNAPGPQDDGASAEVGTGVVDRAEATGARSTLLVKVTLEEGCVLKAVRAYMVIKRLAHMGTVIETHPTERDIEDERFESSFEIVLATDFEDSQVVSAAEYVTEVAGVEVEPLARQEVSGTTGQDHSEAAARRKNIPKVSESQTVRIAIGHLDTMVDLVGELVILRSRLESIAARTDDTELIETVDDLQRISTDLQYEVMQTRMVPVGNIFNRFPRMVRDLALDTGKQIDFEMDGLDIELDRTVLDEIGDPLVHLLRNSIDHGVETPDARIEAGKPAAGRVRLTASRERDHVAIIVSDDGGGMDPERIWSAAVSRGVVLERERSEYSENEILQLTCLPGFSTMTEVTRVSGRGVGLDAVKGKIEYLGGTLRIVSHVGKGTEFVLHLPLTLAIVQSLLVQENDQVFAIPLAAVNEVIRVDDVRVDTVDNAPVLILRDGEVVQLHGLDALLFGGNPHSLPDPGSSIVLMQAGPEQFALSVESIVGRQEIVVKPLSRLFREHRGFSGATVLGDGRVLLILDPRILSASEVRHETQPTQ